MSRFPFSDEMPFGWYLMCYSDELEPAGRMPLTYFGKEWVAWRSTEGEPVVMEAYCPHLGAHLGHGSWVEEGGIRCPFHGWQFDCSGANCDVPYSDRTNKKAKVATLPLHEEDGFVWAWYHPEGAAPMWELPKIPEASDAGFSDWYRRRWKIRTSPQEMAENSVDSAHFRWVHGTVNVPAIEEVEDGFPLMRVKSNQLFDTPMGPQPGFIESNAWGFGFSIVRFSGIVDTCLVGAATPVDNEFIDLKFTFRFRRLGDEDKLNKTVGEALIGDITKQITEDAVIWENKVYLPVPALVPEDGPFRRFRNWAQQFYATDWSESA
ncbi:MAG: Rieske (2Fe-2S) protein [Acidimicrobiia bacterium]|nr:Rieske (2Fe-2S) protein [Acidimicrobiia bacterium]